MGYKLIGGLVIFSLFAVLVIASDNAPPALPSEYWGNVTINGDPAPDGLEVIGLVNSVLYGNMTGGTINGQYNLILEGGDRSLTYDNDRNCAVHWGNNDA